MLEASCSAEFRTWAMGLRFGIRAKSGMNSYSAQTATSNVSGCTIFYRVHHSRTEKKNTGELQILMFKFLVASSSSQLELGARLLESSRSFPQKPVLHLQHN